ncbi:hypothetical protein HAX54_021783 [Datura stramonium]|uniref:Uncharacterized protein n=1 Tax=Datura stramonium TaxID=4076 RepID=A0ABS8UV55_DATST|nr:hypothetical protein [Datura stramonium]
MLQKEDSQNVSTLFLTLQNLMLWCFESRDEAVEVDMMRGITLSSKHEFAISDAGSSYAMSNGDFKFPMDILNFNDGFGESKSLFETSLLVVGVSCFEYPEV